MAASLPALAVVCARVITHAIGSTATRSKAEHFVVGVERNADAPSRTVLVPITRSVSASDTDAG